MDSSTPNDHPAVALPGIYARVRLPQLPNFLQPITGGDSIPLGALSRDDVTILGLAMVRELVASWSRKFAQKHRMTEREAETVGAELIHPAIVERLAMAEAGRDGLAWGGLPQEAKAQRTERMRATLTDFALEVTRYG